MTVEIYQWSDDWEHCQLEFYGKQFIAIDPGKQGAAVAIGFNEPGKFLDCSAVSRDGWAYAKRFRDSGADFVVVVEDQYVGRNPRTAINQAWDACQFALSFGPSAIIRVQPKVWQSMVLPGLRGREELKMGASNVGPELLGHTPKWTKAQLEGLWDAVCIAQWWLWAGEPEEKERAE